MLGLNYSVCAVAFAAIFVEGVDEVGEGFHGLAGDGLEGA